MLAQRPVPSTEGRRIVVSDHSALLQSVTGLLRLEHYCVFQAHDARAAEELCARMPDIALLVVNSHGSGLDLGELIRRVRLASPAIKILHIGSTIPAGTPDNVPTISEEFTAESLVTTVRRLIERRLIPRLPGATNASGRRTLGQDGRPGPRA
jgi:DNA-binding NtrC family response regulator